MAELPVLCARGTECAFSCGAKGSDAATCLTNPGRSNRPRRQQGSHRQIAVAAQNLSQKGNSRAGQSSYAVQKVKLGRPTAGGRAQREAASAAPFSIGSLLLSCGFAKSRPLHGRTRASLAFCESHGVLRGASSFFTELSARLRRRILEHSHAAPQASPGCHLQTPADPARPHQKPLAQIGHDVYDVTRLSEGLCSGR